jgi:hypothetical protein
MTIIYQIKYEQHFSSSDEFLFFLAGDVMSRYGISITDKELDFRTLYGSELWIFDDDGTKYTIVLDKVWDDEDDIYVDYFVTCAHPHHEAFQMIEL